MKHIYGICDLVIFYQNIIERLVEDGPLNMLELKPLPIYESCLEGKITKRPFSWKGQRVQECLELVHTDVCGSLNVQARGGFKYFIMFTDDHFWYGYIYLMHHKSATFKKFRQFKSETEKQVGKNWSDWGGEYLSREFLDFLIDNGIPTQLTPPGMRQLNGVEKKEEIERFWIWLGLCLAICHYLFRSGAML